MAKKKIKRKIFTGIGMLILVVGLLFLLFSGGNEQLIHDIIAGEPASKILEDVQSLGWRGGVVFGVLSMVQVVMTFFPAEPVQVLAGLSYGLWIGILICTAGVIVGNTIVYILCKVYGDRLKDYFQKNIEVDFDVLRKSKRVTLLIFILYILPAIPYGLICFFTSSLNFKYPKYIVVTLLGSIPSIVVGVALGHITANNWIVSVVIFLLIVVALILLGIYRKQVFAKFNEYAKKHFDYSSKTEVQEPNERFSARIFRKLKSWLNKRIKLDVKRNVEQIDHPAIVLCNHGSFIDFAYLAMLLSGDKPHVVATRQYFYEKRLGNLLKKLGCIPKSLFTTDVESVKNCLHVLKNDGVLVVFPEARLCTAGEFEDIQPGTMGFLRKMGAEASIYVLKFSGDYLALPKWARKGNKRFIRRGSTVEAEFSLLYAKGASVNVPADEFEKTVNDALAYNDFEWLQRHPELHYPQGNLAEGLDNVLYRCPECGSEFSLTAQGNTLSCAHCGSSFTMDDRYSFTSGKFENLQQWYHWQLEELRKQIEAEANWQLSDDVSLFHSSVGGANQLHEAGKGRCVFDRNGLTYTGTDGGNEIVKTFPISQLHRILFGAGADFEVYEGEEIWYFTPEDKRTCVKWFMSSVILCK